MQNDWPTKDRDLEVADKILEKYEDMTEQDNISLLEIHYKSDERPDFRLSDWVVELSNYFENRYGEERGQDITRRVLTLYVVRRETVH